MTPPHAGAASIEGRRGVRVKKPKKLNLSGALKITREPLKRFGDLICVIFDEAISGNSDHQWRPIYAPATDRNIKEFPQPETGDQLRQLYAAGGWIESCAHFSEEELALSREYLGGFVRAPGYAGDLGDASAFESDCKEVMASLPPEFLEGELRAKTWETVRRAILHQHSKYKLSANLGSAHRQGSSAGGAAAADSKKAEAVGWHAECVGKARALLAQGKNPRELAGILSTHFGRSTRQINEVLKKAEVK